MTQESYYWYVGTNVSEDNSALTMEAVCSSEIITFTYHVTTRSNNPEALYVCRQFIGVDLAIFLPLEMRVLLNRIGSVETPTIIELHSTNGLYIWGNCLLLITAIAHRLSRQRHKYDASTLLYSSGWKSVRPWLWRRVTYEPCAACWGQFAWLIRVVIVNTPVVNWYLVNGSKEISMSSSVALLHLPLRINTARIANRNWGYGFRIPARKIYFLKILPSGCGIHPASFSVGSGVIYKR
jgi:hypothetical protein